MIKFNVPPYIEGTEKYVLEVMRSGEIAGDNKYTKLDEEILAKKFGSGACRFPDHQPNRRYGCAEEGEIIRVVDGRLSLVRHQEMEGCHCHQSHQECGF